MKKYISILSLIAVGMILSCNPNKEIYEQLDELEKPYSEAFSYKITEADFMVIKSIALKNAKNKQDSAIAKDLTNFMSFSAERDVAILIPAFLKSKFKALDSGSVINVIYTFDDQKTVDENNIIEFKDTVLLGSEPKDYLDTIKKTLLSPKENDVALVKYIVKIENNGNVTYDNSYVMFKCENAGNWTEEKNTYSMIESDYQALGTGNNQPGQYNNFSLKAKTGKYLPILLKNKYSYAQEGDKITIIYKFYNKGAKTCVNTCLYTNGEWIVDEEKKDQFIHNGEQWNFDPTVIFTMKNADYQIIVDWIKVNDSLKEYIGYDNKREFYFGANAKYTDFNMTISKRKENDPNKYLEGLTDEQILKEMERRLPIGIQVLLENKYPNAVPIVKGMKVYYIVSYLYWTPGFSETYSVKFECISPGTFKLLEGPTLVE